MTGRSLASSACGSLSSRSTAESLKLPSSRIAPAPTELQPGALRHAQQSSAPVCESRRAAPCLRRRRRRAPRPPRRRPTPTPPPKARPPPARASARRPPQTAEGSPGRRLQPSWSKSAAELRRRGRPGALACPPARHAAAAAAAPSPRRHPPMPPPKRGTRGRTAARWKQTQRRAPRCRPRGSAAPAPPTAPTAATPPLPPPPTAHC
eukprot:scaffold76342_cov71-Phaeocystis_antarctica.AAC.2